VIVDGVDLGPFTGCEGLSAEFETTEYQEGGQNSFTHRLVGRLKYPTIRLTRAVDSHSAQLAAWFSSLQRSRKRGTANIIAYNAAQKAVAKWTLVEALPMRWSGPQLTVDSTSVARETLELTHNGFID
jgi:phage tail-like protein